MPVVQGQCRTFSLRYSLLTSSRFSVYIEHLHAFFGRNLPTGQNDATDLAREIARFNLKRPSEEFLDRYRNRKINEQEKAYRASSCYRFNLEDKDLSKTVECYKKELLNIFEKPLPKNYLIPRSIVKGFIDSSEGLRRIIVKLDKFHEFQILPSNQWYRDEVEGFYYRELSPGKFEKSSLHSAGSCRANSVEKVLRDYSKFKKSPFFREGEGLELDISTE